MSDLEENEIIEQSTEQNIPEKPVKFNKNGKQRKQLSPEHLLKLAKAREKANAIRKQQTIKKLESKVEKLNSETEPILGVKPKKEPIEPKEPIQEPKETEETQESEETQEIVKEKKSKPKGKKKTKIIVEQSSDDSDEFEQNDNVVFVKRVSRKKKEPVQTTEPVEEQLLPQPRALPPPRQELTREQRLLKSQYESMFSGGFINQMRRPY